MGDDGQGCAATVPSSAFMPRGHGVSLPHARDASVRRACPRACGRAPGAGYPPPFAVVVPVVRMRMSDFIAALLCCCSGTGAVPLIEVVNSLFRFPSSVFSPRAGNLPRFGRCGWGVGRSVLPIPAATGLSPTSPTPQQPQRSQRNRIPVSVRSRARLRAGGRACASCPCVCPVACACARAFLSVHPFSNGAPPLDFMTRSMVSVIVLFGLLCGLTTCSRCQRPHCPCDAVRRPRPNRGRRVGSRTSACARVRRAPLRSPADPAVESLFRTLVNPALAERAPARRSSAAGQAPDTPAPPSPAWPLRAAPEGTGPWDSPRAAAAPGPGRSTEFIETWIDAAQGQHGPVGGKAPAAAAGHWEGLSAWGRSDPKQLEGDADIGAELRQGLLGLPPLLPLEGLGGGDEGEGGVFL